MMAASMVSPEESQRERLVQIKLSSESLLSLNRVGDRGKERRRFIGNAD